MVILYSPNKLPSVSLLQSLNTYKKIDTYLKISYNVKRQTKTQIILKKGVFLQQRNIAKINTIS